MIENIATQLITTATNSMSDTDVRYRRRKIIIRDFYITIISIINTRFNCRTIIYY